MKGSSWDDDRDEMIRRILKTAWVDTNAKMVKIEIEGEQLEVTTKDELLELMNDPVYNAWYATIPFDGGDTLEEFDPVVLEEAVDAKIGRFYQLLKWE